MLLDRFFDRLMRGGRVSDDRFVLFDDGRRLRDRFYRGRLGGLGSELCFVMRLNLDRIVG